jgi:hypothetical protein
MAPQGRKRGPPNAKAQERFQQTIAKNKKQRDAEKEALAVLEKAAAEDEGKKRRKSFFIKKRKKPNEEAEEIVDDHAFMDADGGEGGEQQEQANYFDAEQPEDDFENNNEEYDEDEEDEYQPFEGNNTSHTFVRKVMERLRMECKAQSQNDPYLLKHLSGNDYWIRQCHVKHLCKKLNLSFKEEELSYFMEMKVWLPEKQWGEAHWSPCPQCKQANEIARHALDCKRLPRRVFGLNRSYYLIGYRNKCNRCSRKAAQMKKDQAGNNSNDGPRYTFTSWHPESLKLSNKAFAFPAVLTARSGLDRDWHEMLPALVVSGMRIESIANMIVERYEVRHVQEHIQYEREHAATVLPKKRSMFSKFDDRGGYNERRVSPKYIRTIFLQEENKKELHYLVELKKRGATMLFWDASYKISKLVCKVGGQALYKALVTGTNEFGEIRVQLHVVTDGHDQMRDSIEKFKETVKAYGQEELQLFFTDDVAKDKSFFQELFPSLVANEKEWNKLVIEQAPEVSLSLSLSLSLL